LEASQVKSDFIYFVFLIVVVFVRQKRKKKKKKKKKKTAPSLSRPKMALHLDQNKGWLLRHVHNHSSGAPQSPWVQVIRVLRDPTSAISAAPPTQSGW
jgi:hypothetical protein